MSFCSSKAARRVLSLAALGLFVSVGHASTFVMQARYSGASRPTTATALLGQGDTLYSDSRLVFGDSASVVQLDVPSAGVLSLAWSDLDFGSSLANLDVELSNGLQALGNFQTDGSTTLDLAGPVKLYVTVFAAAQGTMDVGLYHLSATFAPAVAAVPLPRLGVLGLGIAALVIFVLGWGRRWHTPTFRATYTKL
jgi:hypothetical protein